MNVEYIVARCDGFSEGYLSGRRDTHRKVHRILDENLAVLRDIKESDMETFEGDYLVDVLDTLEELKEQFGGRYISNGN